MRDLILDGEAIALRADGRPHPFQVTMRRFGRKLEDEALRRELPLSVFFFDCLLRDDQPLVDLGARQRREVLAQALPSALLTPSLVTSDLVQAEAFYADARAHGHEGLMAKSLDAPYEAGRRGAGWLKVKSAHTLDLVVIAVEWGSGRRKGWLSNLHLGARDPATGGFVMLGKTFKGLTDETLEWQTRELLARETKRDEWTVYVRPELVVEIAFNDVQQSSQYPGGMALRFARVKGYRPDKRPEEADTIDTVRRLYEQGVGLVGWLECDGWPQAKARWRCCACCSLPPAAAAVATTPWSAGRRPRLPRSTARPRAAATRFRSQAMHRTAILARSRALPIRLWRVIPTLRDESGSPIPGHTSFRARRSMAARCRWPRPKTVWRAATTVALRLHLSARSGPMWRCWIQKAAARTGGSAPKRHPLRR